MKRTGIGFAGVFMAIVGIVLAVATPVLAVSVAGMIVLAVGMLVLFVTDEGADGQTPFDRLYGRWRGLPMPVTRRVLLVAALIVLIMAGVSLVVAGLVTLAGHYRSLGAIALGLAILASVMLPKTMFALVIRGTSGPRRAMQHMFERVDQAARHLDDRLAARVRRSC